MRSTRNVTGDGIFRIALVMIAATTGLFIATPAFAGTGKGGAELAGVLTGIFGVAALGFGLGAFGLMVNHIFHKRTVLAYIFLKKKPGWSFLTGVIVTLLGFGLVALFEGVEAVQGIILLLYLLGLGMFGIGAVMRLAGYIVEPRIIEDDPPSTWAFIKGGFIFMAVNIVVVIGNAVAIGVLIAGIGATLLSYFAGMGSAVSDVAKAGGAAIEPKPE